MRCTSGLQSWVCQSVCLASVSCSGSAPPSCPFLGTVPPAAARPAGNRSLHPFATGELGVASGASGAMALLTSCLLWTAKTSLTTTLPSDWIATEWAERCALHGTKQPERRQRAGAGHWAVTTMHAWVRRGERACSEDVPSFPPSLRPTAGVVCVGRAAGKRGLPLHVAGHCTR